MYHLLIERVSTVTIEFLQYRARVRIGLNRASIERVVEQTDLFTSLRAAAGFGSNTYIENGLELELSFEGLFKFGLLLARQAEPSIELERLDRCFIIFFTFFLKK